MDRQIVYPGSIPLDTDVLSLQRNAMVALGYLAQVTLGSGMTVDGLSCYPTAPPSLKISIGPGSISSLSVIDAAPFGSIPADGNDPLVKMGINTGPTSFTLTAPLNSGQAINYLVQATLSEADATPVVLPYYNAANPLQPFGGQANNGIPQSTQRLQRVQLQLKPSAPANAGSQATPAVDNGWVGLYVITVNYGQSQVNWSNISIYPTAPFIAFKLNTLTPGFSRMAIFTASGSFTVPIGSSTIKVRLCGGGGGGGSGTPDLGGGGGGAGGYSESSIAVQSGQTIGATVGYLGLAAIAGGSFAGGGGPSAFGPVSATGGNGGASAATFAFGGSPGQGSGGGLNLGGGYGSDGNGGRFTLAGNGGASFFGGGGRAANAGGSVEQNALAPGSGGGGCYGVSGNGGAGAPGIVIVEF